MEIFLLKLIISVEVKFTQKYEMNYKCTGLGNIYLFKPLLAILINVVRI